VQDEDADPDEEVELYEIEYMTEEKVYKVKRFKENKYNPLKEKISNLVLIEIKAYGI